MNYFSGVSVTYRLLLIATGKKHAQSLCLPTRRKLLKGLALVLMLSIVGSVVQAEARRMNQRYFFDVPSQPVRSALSQVARQAEYQLVVSSELVGTLKSKPLKGRFTVKKALAVVLKGTFLSGSVTERGVIVVQPLSALDNNYEGKDAMNVKKNVLALAVGLFAGAGSVPSAFAEGVTEQGRIDEILVTATKRETSLQDTALSISAIGGDAIDKQNLVSMDDYLRNVPGVSFQDRGAGQNSIVIRGMATDPQFEGSTAGAYFGETSIANMQGPSNAGSGGNADVKLVDIERVEVLRGPQGTLYGAGSMAGTVRIIPNAPKLDTLEGSVATGFSNTTEAGGDNHSVKAVLNLPVIEDKLAVRGVVYRFDNSGFIENVAASQPTPWVADAVTLQGAVAEDKGDRGGDTYTGFRLSALWQITEQIDATLSYLNQEIEQDGLPEVNILAAGDFQQQRLNVGRDQQGDEFLESELDIVSLVLNYDLGWATISSASSWLDNDASTNQDTTALWHAFAFPAAYFIDNTSATEIFIEELRLASQLDGPLQFVAGLYYEDRDSERDLFTQWSGDQSIDPFPPSGLPLSLIHSEGHVEQKAVFGELTYDFSEHWAVTLGARHFDYEVEQVESNTFIGTVLFENRRTGIEETGQTYKGALNYAPNEDLLIYGQWAQGFRIGRGQIDSPTCAAIGIPFPDIDSDRTETLEFGVKSAWLDNRITFNAAVYQTDWDDIPVVVNLSSDPICSPILNAGKAQSEGVEIELQARLTENLQLDISASTVDATLDETSSIGNKGDDLPGSADYNASVALEYNFTLGSYPSFVRIDYSYVGEYFNNIEGIGTPAGDFSQVDVKFGAEVGQVKVDLFVTNLTSETGFTWVEASYSIFTGSQRAFSIRPRTVGINLAYHF